MVDVSDNDYYVSGDVPYTDEVHELRAIILTLVKIVAKRPLARLDWETLVEIERKLNET